MHDLVVRNGLVVTAAGARRADVGVDGGRIAAVGRGLAGDHTLDATGCYVIPGAVDIHVHLQMALGGRVSSDSFADGTVAAACGGTTMVIDFVDPQPGESLIAAYAKRRREADGQVAVDYGLHMTIPAWHAAQAEMLAEIPRVLAAGCLSFKLYQAYPRVMLDDVALLRVLQAVGRAGGIVVLHSETGPVLDELRRQALDAGARAPIWHAKTRPARLEATAVHRAAELAYLAGCPLHIFHVGCAEVVAEVASAAARGMDITAETCPQYLLLDAQTHLGGALGELFICAPPLRSPADQEALWGALGRSEPEDVLGIISTDHCPWSAAEKAQPDFSQVPGGVPSIEARVALVHHFGVNAGRLSPARWVEVCCTGPARRMGLARKGQIAVGYDADLVIFDPTVAVTITPECLHETAGWTPYDGLTVTGWPRTVLLRGQTIVEDGTPVMRNAGRFVPRAWGE